MSLDVDIIGIVEMHVFPGLCYTQPHSSLGHVSLEVSFTLLPLSICLWPSTPLLFWHSQELSSGSSLPFLQCGSPSCTGPLESGYSFPFSDVITREWCFAAD